MSERRLHRSLQSRKFACFSMRRNSVVDVLFLALFAVFCLFIDLVHECLAVRGDCHVRFERALIEFAVPQNGSVFFSRTLVLSCLAALHRGMHAAILRPAPCDIDWLPVPTHAMTMPREHFRRFF